MRSPVLALTLTLSSAAMLHAQQALPVGSMQGGLTTGTVPVEYAFDAKDAGFLSVVLRGTTEGGDLVLSVTDEEYQVLTDGRSDQDLGQDFGAEQVMLTLPGAGRYRILVESPYSDEMVAFELGATFLPSRLAASPPDPDGRPSGAIALDVGTMYEDVIDPPAGDGWDWFKFTVPADGVLTVLTRAADMDEGDVKLEIFREGNYREAEQSSDQDQSEVLTNESVTLDVVAGQTLYVRVSPPFSSGGRAAYRIASGLIPG